MALDVIVLNTIPIDLNYDGQLDVIVVGATADADLTKTLFTMTAYLNDRGTFEKGSSVSVSHIQPFAADIHGNLIPSILGYTLATYPLLQEWTWSNGSFSQ